MGARGFETDGLVTEVAVYRSKDDLVRPAELIRSGEVVAFPTETVYGLGANALDKDAIHKIFKAKGRPSDNPLIVHVAEKEQISALVSEITPLARCLIDEFMPGPITLVMRRSQSVPDVVTAGLDTVGIRIPAHPVARELIAMAGVPIAAPSANRSGSPSPTKAEHVLKDLKGRITLIVDGGDCDVGLESTVVDVTGHRPVVLRPGAITSEMIRSACDKIGLSYAQVSVDTVSKMGQTPRSPGQKYRHYAPKSPVTVIHAGKEMMSQAYEQTMISFRQEKPEGVMGVFASHEVCEALRKRFAEEAQGQVVYYEFGSEDDVFSAGQKLYDALRSLDDSGSDRIFAPGFGSEGYGVAYMNRLEKAAGDDSDLDPSAESIKLDGADEDCRQVLFVCTGNTCRSPMAEGIFNSLAKEAGPFVFHDCPTRDAKVFATSAGIFASFGSPAAQNAVEALRQLYGIDISGHRSRRVDETLLSSTHLILTMTQEHAMFLKAAFPPASGRVYDIFSYFENTNIPGEMVRELLKSPAGIPDPFGASLDEYIKTAQTLEHVLSALIPYILENLGVMPISPI